jgi:DNA-directed RNA polymerase subunit alpha
MSDTDKLTEVDHVELLKAKDLSIAKFVAARKELYSTIVLRRRVQKFAEPHVLAGPGALDEATAQHVGICLAGAGVTAKALPFLEKAAKSRPARYALGLCQLAARDTEAALGTLRKLLAESPEDRDVLRSVLDVQSSHNDVPGFRKTYEASKNHITDKGDRHYCEGFLLEREGKTVEAVEEYRKAIEADPEHARALFRLAYRLDMNGDEEEAIELYERCCEFKPTFSSVYLNLGVLYDDREEYDNAIECFRALLDIDPNNSRAKLFLKDSTASLDMYYDEDQERREDKLNQILRIPVTDFELSVRSRNCLERMKIRTLGDLIRKTEPELLSYKNFGETSLAEIKEILTSKNLQLGMGREELEISAGKPDSRIERLKAIITGIGTPTDDAMARPIGELDLSVRSRRCMTRLGIQTLGELCSRSETELLSVRNFGQTSLVEIKEKLRGFGLNLKEG